MITRVVLAKLSPTMEEGTIVAWHKNEGDPIKIGDVLAEIETDKANMEMEALGEGTLRKILVAAGGSAPVGSLIGVIADPDEDIEATLAKAQKPAPAAQPVVTPPPAPATPSPALPQPATVSTPAQPPPGAPVAVQLPARVAAAPAARVKASPLARKMAAARSIPLNALAGTGPGGRVIKRDVEAFATAGPRSVPSPAAPASRAPQPVGPQITPGERLPHSKMRKTIARRLAKSKYEAPHYYVTVDVEMDRAVSLKQQLAEAETKVSYNDMIVKAAARALARFPMVNASWSDEAIVTHAEAHIGVAVAIEDGLITPVVRNADSKSVMAIAAEIRELAGRARTKKLRPDEYMGSTFTISNLGMFDVTEFTAIINPPDSAILAVGSVQKLPVVVDDKLGVGYRMKLTMSSDHRVIDGALAAQFLAELRRLLENPITLLV